MIGCKYPNASADQLLALSIPPDFVELLDPDQDNIPVAPHECLR